MPGTTTPRRNTARKTVEVRQTDDYGHLQPQAPELERAVLGAMMIESDAYGVYHATNEGECRRDELAQAHLSTVSVTK